VYRARVKRLVLPEVSIVRMSLKSPVAAIVTKAFTGLLTLAISLALSSAPARGQTDIFKQYHDYMVQAIGHQQLQQVQALLKTPYIIINDPNYQNPTYLGQAVIVDDPDIVQVLIDAGEDPTWSAPAGATYFHFSVQNLKSNAVLTVLIAAAKKSTGSVDSPKFQTLINSRRQPELYSPLQLMITRISDFTSNYPDREDRAIALATALIELGHANPNTPDRYGKTALGTAQGAGYPKLAAYLAQHGAH
jgi:hypothetical protein